MNTPTIKFFFKIDMNDEPEQTTYVLMHENVVLVSKELVTDPSGEHSSRYTISHAACIRFHMSERQALDYFARTWQEFDRRQSWSDFELTLVKTH